MKEKTITIEIDENGTLKADAEGFEGDTCLHELEKLLGNLGFEQAVIDRKPDAGDRRVRSSRVQRLGRKKG